MLFISQAEITEKVLMGQFFDSVASLVKRCLASIGLPFRLLLSGAIHNRIIVGCC